MSNLPHLAAQLHRALDEWKIYGGSTERVVESIKDMIDDAVTSHIKIHHLGLMARRVPILKPGDCIVCGEFHGEGVACPKMAPRSETQP